MNYINDKLLIINLGKAYGGAEKLIENIVEGLKEEFIISLIINSNGEFERKGNINSKCKVIRFKNNIKTFIFNIIKIIKYAKNEDIKIVHCHGAPAMIVGILLKIFYKTKVVITVHSDITYEFEGVKKKIYLKLESLSAKFADVIVAVSGNLEEKLKNRNKKYSNKIIKIYNGLYVEDKEFVKKENDIPKILFVGRLVEIKNIEYFIYSLKKLQFNGKLFKCDIIGEGELEEKLINMVKELELEEYVNFLGFKEDVRRHMLSSDFMVIPSKMEGVPLVIIEAFASKLPVIASSVGGIVEMITDNHNGILFDLEKDELPEVLSKAIDKKYDLATISENAYADYKSKWNRDKLADNYKNTFTK